jgi:hypothetical protein
MSEETKVDADYMIAKLGLTVDSVYVPMERGEDPRLKWVVTLKRHGKPVLTCTYTAGVAHAPSWPKNMAYEECRRGWYYVFGHQGKMTPILPKTVDVVASLCWDAEAIDYGSFEDWASTYGYDPDSRKAEAMYKQCVEHGLKLRAAIGDASFAALCLHCSEL